MDDAPHAGGVQLSREAIIKGLDKGLDRSQRLLEINAAIISHADLPELLRAVSACLRREITHDFASMCLYDPDSDQLRMHALDFSSNPGLVKTAAPIPLDGTVDGLTFRTRRTVIRDRLDLVEFPSEAILAEGLKSCCLVPLSSLGRTLGTLAVASVRESAFTTEDAETLTQIASQVAIAVESAISFEEVRVTREKARILLGINNAIVSHLDLTQLIKAVSNCLRRVMPHDFAALAIYDAERNVLRLHAMEFPPGMQFVQMWQELPLEGTPPGLAFSSQRPVLRSRLDPNEFHFELVKDVVAKGVTSICAVPLICQGRSVGAMGVSSLKEGAFTEQDAELLNQIGGQVALAVQNAMNFEQLRAAEQEVARQRDRSRLLLEINNAVVSHLDLRELVKSISDSVRRIIPHEGAFLTLFNSERTRLRVQALDLRTPDTVPFEEGVMIELEGTPEGEAIASRQAVLVVPVIDLDRFYSPWVRKAFDNNVRSGCAVPLIAHGRPLGALSVVSLREAAFNEEDARLLAQCSNQIAIAVENALAYREIEGTKNKLAQEKVYLEDEIRSECNFEEIVGESPALRHILKQIEKVAPTDSTILIRGETGTGKELIARAIHNLSGRRERTLVKVNCAAIPMGLLESELFGHERGAFTGAVSQRIGRFELANQGTLFLDEVGDIPLELQPKLLRVLQEQQFERLGSTRTQQVNVRLVAATNCDLEKMVADKQYRSDLYYRLNVFPVTIPPLRNRPEDIPLLVRFFAQKLARRMKKPIESIPAKTSAALAQYHWPGNVRELENVIERAVILSQGPELEIPLGELKMPERVAHAVPARNEPEKPAPSTLQSIERDHILRVLEECRWVIAGPGGAAARLGMKRTTLQAKMRKLGLSRRN